MPFQVALALRDLLARRNAPSFDFLHFASKRPGKSKLNKDLITEVCNVFNISSLKVSLVRQKTAVVRETKTKLFSTRF